MMRQRHGVTKEMQVIQGDTPAGATAGKPAPHDAPWSGERGLTPRRGIDLLSLVPLFAIVALVALVALVIWVAGRSEAEQARTKLATDALWVEQTLRFQISVDEDMLARMALDAASGTIA